MPADLYCIYSRLPRVLQAGVCVQASVCAAGSFLNSASELCSLSEVDWEKSELIPMFSFSKRLC